MPRQDRMKSHRATARALRDQRNGPSTASHVLCFNRLSWKNTTTANARTTTQMIPKYGGSTNAENGNNSCPMAMLMIINMLIATPTAANISMPSSALDMTRKFFRTLSSHGFFMIVMDSLPLLNTHPDRRVAMPAFFEKRKL